jgi:hypothetical protein
MDQECQPTSLLSFLEAENIRLRRAVVELWTDTAALREAMKREEFGEAGASARPPHRHRAPRAALIYDGDRPSSE